MKNSTTLIILNALFFAAAMLVAAYWATSKTEGILVNNFLIALWFASNAYISKGKNNKCG